MTLKISEERKRTMLLGGSAIRLCISIFFAYRVLYTAGVSEYAKEFTAGCIGAVITIFATAALLRSQNENDVTKDQLAGMFREKLELYKSFIHFLNSINVDGEIDRNELREAVEWGGKLSLVCKPAVIRELHDYIFQVVAFGSDNFKDLEEDQKVVWRRWIQGRYGDMKDDIGDEDFCIDFYSSRARIIGMLRDDLAQKKLADLIENVDLELSLEELFSLHSVADIRFCADGSVEIEQAFEPVPKKRARRPKAATGNAIKTPSRDPSSKPAHA